GDAARHGRRGLHRRPGDRRRRPRGRRRGRPAARRHRRRHRTSEAAVLHAMDAHEALHGTAVDVVLLVQCTSPFIVREDLDGVAGAIVENGADTAVTVAPFHGFIWRDADTEATSGEVTGGYGVNHDKSFRPR